MSHDPVNLDSRRDAAGVMGVEMRFSVAGPTAAARAAAALDLAQIERRLAAGPAENWAQAAEHAIALLAAYGATADARDGRRQALIARTIADLDRLSLPEADGAIPPASAPSGPGDAVGPMPGDPDASGPMR